jgi:hypothetical protein
MPDMQLLTLAITLLGIFGASWYNSSRVGDVSARVNRKIDDVNTSLSKHIDDLRDVLRAEMCADKAEMKAEFASLRSLLEKIGDSLSRELADYETRISKLEGNRQTP